MQNSGYTAIIIRIPRNTMLDLNAHNRRFRNNLRRCRSMNAIQSNRAVDSPAKAFDVTKIRSILKKPATKPTSASTSSLKLMNRRKSTAGRMQSNDGTDSPSVSNQLTNDPAAPNIASNVAVGSVPTDDDTQVGNDSPQFAPASVSDQLTNDPPAAPIPNIASNTTSNEVDGSVLADNNGQVANESPQFAPVRSDAIESNKENRINSAQAYDSVDTNMSPHTPNLDANTGLTKRPIPRLLRLTPFNRSTSQVTRPSMATTIALNVINGAPNRYSPRPYPAASEVKRRRLFNE